MIELKGKYSSAKIMIDDIESDAIRTIQSIIDSPVSEDQPVCIMPDVHQGAGGIVIGFSMTLGNMLSPNMVGVDINCGVLSGFFVPKKSLDLYSIKDQIRDKIPMGFNTHKKSLITELPLNEIQVDINYFVKRFNKKYNSKFNTPLIDEKWLTSYIKRVGISPEKFWNSLGTLGGGNHYIEVSVSESGEYMISIHSGSRNLGQKVCMYHVNQAKLQTNFSQDEYAKNLDDIRLNTIDKTQIQKKISELKKEMGVGINKEYLQGEYMFNYLIDMIVCQKYATINRELMLNVIKDIIGVQSFEKTIETRHNYIDFSDDKFMIRKGSISAKKGEISVIPISMAFGSLLVKAKGLDSWNQTLPHGAGRVLSRSAAKAKIELSDVKKSMKGIVCDINKHVIDESCFAYKKPDVIQEAIKENAEIINIYSPILNIKDIGEAVSWKEKKELKKKRDLERKNQRKMKRG